MIMFNSLLFHIAIPIRAKNVERLFQLEEEHYRIWRVIGTKLGVDMDTLSVIEEYVTIDKDRLHSVIDCANPAPTHEAMTKILESEHITNAIAGTIM